MNIMWNDLRIINDDQGTLVPIENLPFEIKRVFYVTNVPEGEERGNHAHYNTQQLLICIKGKIIVKLFDGHNNECYTIEENQSVFVDKLIWDSQVFLDKNTVMLSLCSTNYDNKDYIEDKDYFIKLKQK